MTLELQAVSRSVEGRVHIHPTNLTLERGTMNVLLGPTLSGKTSLMRLMAGLDAPTTGRILWQGRMSPGMRVQDRKVAMVYQQFINYPAMTVYDNIASPLRLMGKCQGRDRPRRARNRRDAAPDPDAGPQAAGTVGRPAAALRPGARLVKGAGLVLAGRAAGQSGLQAARGIAGRDPPDLRGLGRDLRLCHDRTGRGAAAGRQYRHPVGRPRDAVRPDASRSTASPPMRRPRGCFRPADELHALQQGRAAR